MTWEGGYCLSVQSRMEPKIWRCFCVQGAVEHYRLPWCVDWAWTIQGFFFFFQESLKVVFLMVILCNLVLVYCSLQKLDEELFMTRWQDGFYISIWHVIQLTVQYKDQYQNKQYLWLCSFINGILGCIEVLRFGAWNTF